jgi:4-hydroxybenzoate polyprenyltransferase
MKRFFFFPQILLNAAFHLPHFLAGVSANDHVGHLTSVQTPTEKPQHDREKPLRLP